MSWTNNQGPLCFWQETKDSSRKPSAAREEVGFATPTRARLGALESTPKKVILQADDEGSETSTQAEALLELVRELKMGREEDDLNKQEQMFNEKEQIDFSANLPQEENDITQDSVQEGGEIVD